MQRATGLQLLRFSVVGAVNTGIQFAVFMLLWRLGHVHYLAASGAGYACGLINGYVMNRRWTFESTDRNWQRGFAVFVAVNAVALGVNTAVLHVAVARAAANPVVGQFVAIAASLPINFLGNRLWTFRQPPTVPA